MKIYDKPIAFVCFYDYLYYLGIKSESIQFTTNIFQITRTSWNLDWNFPQKLSFPCCAAISWRFLHIPSLFHFSSVFVLCWRWCLPKSLPWIYSLPYVRCLRTSDFGSYVFNASLLRWTCNTFTLRDGLTVIHCHHWITGITSEIFLQFLLLLLLLIAERHVSLDNEGNDSIGG